MNGVLNLDKPAGISSAGAVGRVKWLLPRGTKIGHAGTLDPFATGVLLLLIGKATKLCESLMDQPKQYETTVKLGETTATDDCESPPIPTPSTHEVSIEEIKQLLPRFVGEISQRPPDFSAMKIAGRRAYDLARRGNPVKLNARPVRIDSLELLSYSWPLLQLRIDCGRGTYIRSLARDIGEALNVGGHLTQLRRTRVGDFYAGSAVPLSSLTPELLAERLVPLPVSV
jgi:tRNA pseudouridine55 synthase